MNRISKNIKIAIGAVVIIVIVIVAIRYSMRPEYEYQLSLNQTQQILQDENALILPADARKFVEARDPAYVFVDLRSPYEYIKGNIEGSYNIQSGRILDEENIDLLDEWNKKNRIMIIYHDDESAAVGIWMILRQLGYRDTRILAGGWLGYAGFLTDPNLTRSKKDFLNDHPKYNYAGFMKGSGHQQVVSDKQTTTAPVILQRKEKKSKVEGGC